MTVTEVSDYIGPVTVEVTTEETHDRAPFEVTTEFNKMAAAAAKAKTQLVCSKPVAASETFYVCHFGGSAGGQGIKITCEQTDGSTPATGPVWQGRTASEEWQAEIHSHFIRHMMGTYSGGRGRILKGSESLGCSTSRCQ